MCPSAGVNKNPQGVEPWGMGLFGYVVSVRVCSQHPSRLMFRPTFRGMMACKHRRIIYPYLATPSGFSACAYFLNVSFNQWRKVFHPWIVATPWPTKQVNVYHVSFPFTCSTLPILSAALPFVGCPGYRRNPSSVPLRYEGKRGRTISR